MTSFLARSGLPPLAYIRTDPARVSQQLGVLYLGGYMSSKAGSKVTNIRRHLEDRGHSVVSFDYTDKGESVDANIPRIWSLEQWRQDCLTILDQLTTGPQLLIGSSMGAWMTLLVATARPERIRGVVTISAAVGFTERLRKLITDEHRAAFDAGEIIELTNNYGPMPVSKRFLDDGTKLNLLSGAEPINVLCPIRCCHSIGDDLAPYRVSLDIVQRVRTPDASAHIRRAGDHFMQSPEELQVILRCVHELIDMDSAKL